MEVTGYMSLLVEEDNDGLQLKAPNPNLDATLHCLKEAMLLCGTNLFSISLDHLFI